MTGKARFLRPGSDEESWCKERHLENNTFEEEMGSVGQQQPDGSHRRPSVSLDDDVRVVSVRVNEGRIADWKGCVRDWRLVTEEPDATAGLVNGIPS